MMNLIERTKSILISPKEEWSKIGQENDTPVKLLTTYLLWLDRFPDSFGGAYRLFGVGHTDGAFAVCFGYRGCLSDGFCF